MYPVISGCAKIKNYHNVSNFDGKDCIFMARVGSAGEVLLYEGPCYLTDLSFGLKCNSNTFLKLFLFYSLKYNCENIKNSIQSKGPPNINGNILKKVIIKIPSIEQQQNIIFLYLKYLTS